MVLARKGKLDASGLFLVGLFCGNIRLFCGDIGLFCGNIGMFGLHLVSHVTLSLCYGALLQICRALCGNIGLLCRDVLRIFGALFVCSGCIWSCLYVTGLFCGYVGLFVEI